MAIATHITISTSSKALINDQGQEVTLSVSYQLERQDTDLFQLAAEKTAEVEHTYSIICGTLRDLRSQHLRSQSNEIAAPSPKLGTSGSEHPQITPLPNEKTPAAISSNGINTLPRPAESSQGETVHRTSSHSHHAHSNDVHSNNGAAQAEGVTSELSKSPLHTQDALTTPQRRAIYSLVARAELNDEEIERLLQARFSKAAVEDLTSTQATSLILELQRKERNKTSVGK